MIYDAIYTEHGREFPFVDCYGLVKHLYKEEQGIDIVDFDYVDPADPKNEKFFHESLNNPRWVEVKAQKGAVVAMKTSGHINHCGYMISNNKFVHILGDTGVTVQSIQHQNWKHRIVGFYRYD